MSQEGTMPQGTMPQGANKEPESKAEIEFISEGFKEILNSKGVHDLLEQIANDIKSRADSNIGENSEGFKVTVMEGNYGGGRWVAHVQTTDHATMVAEAEHKALTKAVR